MDVICLEDEDEDGGEPENGEAPEDGGEPENGEAPEDGGAPENGEAPDGAQQEEEEDDDEIQIVGETQSRGTKR
jgi:hypothetical protein